MIRIKRVNLKNRTFWYLQNVTYLNAKSNPFPLISMKVWRQALPIKGQNKTCSDMSCSLRRVSLGCCFGGKKSTLLLGIHNQCSVDQSHFPVSVNPAANPGDRSHLATCFSKPDCTPESPGQLIRPPNCLFQTQTTRMISQEGPQTPLLTVNLSRSGAREPLHVAWGQRLD